MSEIRICRSEVLEIYQGRPVVEKFLLEFGYRDAPDIRSLIYSEGGCHSCSFTESHPARLHSHSGEPDVTARYGNREKEVVHFFRNHHPVRYSVDSGRMTEKTIQMDPVFLALADCMRVEGVVAGRHGCRVDRRAGAF